jgi:hypothetical protein
LPSTALNRVIDCSPAFETGAITTSPSRVRNIQFPSAWINVLVGTASLTQRDSPVSRIDTGEFMMAAALFVKGKERAVVCDYAVEE